MRFKFPEYTEDQFEILWKGVPRIKRAWLLLQYAFWMGLPLPFSMKQDLVNYRLIPKIYTELQKVLFQ